MNKKLMAIVVREEIKKREGLYHRPLELGECNKISFDIDRGLIQ